MILTIFVKGLQGTKYKASSQYNKKNEYASKSNKNLLELVFSNNPVT